MAVIKPHNIGLSLNDSRDSQAYKVILLGQRLWTAENCRYYSMFGTFGLNNRSRNIHELGGFYAQSVVDTVCPPGWDIPTVREWQELYSVWKRNYNDLRFLDFASASIVDDLGTFPMNGIGKMCDDLFDEASFAETDEAAYFWTSTLDDRGERRIFGITGDGCKIFSSTGSELCNLRFVKRLKKGKEGDMS